MKRRGHWVLGLAAAGCVLWAVSRVILHENNMFQVEAKDTMHGRPLFVFKSSIPFSGGRMLEAVRVFDAVSGELMCNVSCGRIVERSSTWRLGDQPRGCNLHLCKPLHPGRYHVTIEADGGAGFAEFSVPPS